MFVKTASVIGLGDQPEEEPGQRRKHAERTLDLPAAVDPPKLAVDGAIHSRPEGPVAGKEGFSFRTEASPGTGAPPALPEQETGASRLFQLTQVAPRIAVGHPELRGGSANGPALADRLQEIRAAMAELYPAIVEDPHAKLRLRRLAASRTASGGCGRIIAAR